MILLFPLLISCNENKSKVETPSVLLTEEQMVDVMIDVQIVESSINYKRSRSQNVNDYKQQAYDAVFSHHGITDSIFIENVNYYNENLPQMKNIMDSVNAYFTTKQEEIKKKK